MVFDELIETHPTIPHSYLKHLVVTHLHLKPSAGEFEKRLKSYTEQEVPSFLWNFKNWGRTRRGIFNDQ